MSKFPLQVEQQTTTATTLSPNTEYKKKIVFCIFKQYNPTTEQVYMQLSKKCNEKVIICYCCRTSEWKSNQFTTSSYRRIPPQLTATSQHFKESENSLLCIFIVSFALRCCASCVTCRLLHFNNKKERINHKTDVNIKFACIVKAATIFHIER